VVLETTVFGLFVAELLIVGLAAAYVVAGRAPDLAADH
jgi:hypothetical protein